MRKYESRYAAVTSTLALIVALGGTAYAIEANSVGPKQIKRNAVRSAEIKGGAVKSADIGSDQVEATNLDLPAPSPSAAESETTTTVGPDFTKVATIGSFTKLEPLTAVSVSWSGAVKSGFYACVFQLRVAGQPDDRDSAKVYVGGSSPQSISVEALFSGLGIGTHEVEVWGRSVGGPGTETDCTVSPSQADIGQTVLAQEIAS